ncbi:MAG: gliding motility protein GldN [Prevotellaceae bacterium]|nr:gliding motility protein GldN [Candidatus Minthosoma caballi]
MRRKLFILSLLLLHSSLFTLVLAQPQKSRVQTNNRTAATRTQQAASSSRAALMFPTAVDVPEEVTWRRDIYRVLDLQKDENAALYFPVEARGDDVNLFTLLFQLLNKGQIPAYQYKLDGVEDFRQANRMHFKDMLDRYKIPYQINGNSINVDPSDIPSSEVLSFYVKESSYYDQNTATYHSRVVAICPVLHRADDFSYEALKYPLFWVKYEDVSKHLSNHMVMTSNVNNAAKMSMDDFFSTNHYQGKIYMTTNMQNKALQELFPTDSLLKKEQTRIEKEMSDFEEHIWKEPIDSIAQAKKDSIAAEASSKGKKVKSSSASSSASRTSRRGGTSASSSKGSKSSSSSSASSGAPRVSVRRQRH